MPDPYDLDDEGRPVAEDRSEEKVRKAEEEAKEAEEAARSGDAKFAAGADPTATPTEAEPTGDADPTAPTAEPDPFAATDSTAEPDLIAGTEVADTAPAADPAAQEAAMRRQIETTLRFMRLQTIVGIIVILALIAFMSSIRGVLVLVLIIFAFSSAGAYWWLRRNLNARLGGPGAS